MRLFGKAKPKVSILDIANHSANLARLEGRNALGVGITDTFTKEDRKCLPEHLTPWIKVETDNLVKLFCYTHFELESEDTYKMVKKGNMVKGLAVLVFNGDGTPWPSEESHCMVHLENSSPFDITKGSQRSQMVVNIVKELSVPGWADRSASREEK